MAQPAVLTTRHINFSAKFPCRRDYLALFLAAAQQHGRDRSAIMQSVGYGRNFHDGFRGWATACQLWNPHSAQPTELGERLQEYDAELTNSVSAWILHAVLCANNPFWQWLFGKFLPWRDAFSTEDAVKGVEEAGLALSRGLRPYVGAILATYYKPEALGVLGVLDRDTGNRVRVRWAQEPPPAVYAWALYNYARKRTMGQSQEVGLSELLSDPAGPGVALFADGRRAETALETLSGQGWVTLRRYAHPYTVAVEVSDEERLWMAMYE